MPRIPVDSQGASEVLVAMNLGSSLTTSVSVKSSSCFRFLADLEN